MPEDTTGNAKASSKTPALAKARREDDAQGATAGSLWARRSVRIAAALVLYSALGAAAVYFTPGVYGPGVRLLIGFLVAFSAATALGAYKYLTPRVGTLTAWVAITLVWSLGTAALAIATGSCNTEGQACTPAAAASWMVAGASWVAVQFTVAGTVFLARRAARLGWNLSAIASSVVWHGRTPASRRGAARRAEEAAASRSGNPAVRANTKPAAGPGDNPHVKTSKEGQSR